MAMLDGKENVNWGPTAILDYFKATYPVSLSFFK